MLANDGAATGCVEATEAEAAVASKPLDEKSDNRGYGNVSAGVGDEVGVGIAEGAARPLRSVPAKSFGYRFVKRVFDIGFSLCVIVIGFVPVALLCLIIRLESPGSPIYFQKRVGRYGTSLSILKLRTMVADSDDVEKYLSPEQLAQWKSERKVDCDPRVTRVGALLRKTSLDELPQFLNVLAWTKPRGLIPNACHANACACALAHAPKKAIRSRALGATHWRVMQSTPHVFLLFD